MGYTFILGGARSGKSRYGEEQALAMAKATSWPVTYLATGVVTDEEMQERIALHRQSRPSEWRTVEEPLRVARWLNEQSAPRVVLLDCLTLLLSNWFFDNADDAEISQRGDEFCQALSDFKYGLFVVSNEVGQGIVPNNGLARRYRDAMGRLNQQVARGAEKVIWMVAGLPVDVRKLAP